MVRNENFIILPLWQILTDQLKQQFILETCSFTDPVFFDTRDLETLFLEQQHAGFIIGSNIAKQLVQVKGAETIIYQYFGRAFL